VLRIHREMHLKFNCDSS